MEKFVTVCSKINQAISCILLITMVCFVFGNTVLRYFFSSGIIITEEFVRYLFLWGVYLGVISVWYTRGHIRVTTVSDRMSPRNRIYLSTVIELVSIAVLLTLGYGSVEYYFDTTTIGQVTNIPYSVMILSVIVGSFACCVISLFHIKQNFELLKNDDETLLRMQKEEEEKALKGE